MCVLGRLPGPRAVSLGLPMLKHDVSSQRNNIFDLPSKLRSPCFSLRPTSGVQGVHWFKAETKNRVSQNWGLTIKGICDKFGRVCMGDNMPPRCLFRAFVLNSRVARCQIELTEVVYNVIRDIFDQSV